MKIQPAEGNTLISNEEASREVGTAQAVSEILQAQLQQLRNPSEGNHDDRAVVVSSAEARDSAAQLSSFLMASSFVLPSVPSRSSGQDDSQSGGKRGSYGDLEAFSVGAPLETSPKGLYEALHKVKDPNDAANIIVNAGNDSFWKKNEELRFQFHIPAGRWTGHTLSATLRGLSISIEAETSSGAKAFSAGEELFSLGRRIKSSANRNLAVSVFGQSVGDDDSRFSMPDSSVKK